MSEPTIFDSNRALPAVAALVLSMGLRPEHRLPAGKMIAALCESISQCAKHGGSLDLEFRIFRGSPQSYVIRDWFTRRIGQHRVFRPDGSEVPSGE